MGFINALAPQKNLALAVLGAFIVISVEMTVKKLFGINMAVEIAQLYSTPDHPLTPQTVLIAEATAVGYLIAHACNIIDKHKNDTSTEKPQ